MLGGTCVSSGALCRQCGVGGVFVGSRGCWVGSGVGLTVAVEQSLFGERAASVAVLAKDLP